MKNAILVPGRPDKDEHYDPTQPSNSENHWFSWLKRNLILKDIQTVSMEPPFPFRPRYEDWLREFERYDINSDTALVGHSCGGGFLIRYLSEHKDLRVGKVILVAPWLNPENNPVSDTADFFHFDLDPEFPNRTASTVMFSSDNDQETIQKSVDIIKNSVPGISVREFHAYGHFCLENLKTDQFPELLDELLN